MARPDRDEIMRKAAGDIRSTYEGEGVVGNVILIYEVYDPEGEPFIHCLGTEEAPWWTMAGMMEAARIILAGGDLVPEDDADDA